MNYRDKFNITYNYFNREFVTWKKRKGSYFLKQ